MCSIAPVSGLRWGCDGAVMGEHRLDMEPYENALLKDVNTYVRSLNLEGD